MSLPNVGITGGIGSGKSLICSIFASLGYAVYDADSRAKALMTEDPMLIEQLKENFGSDAYREDGGLNRAYLGGIVFNDPDKLQQLNAIVHPATGRDFLAWQANQSQQTDKAFLLKEAAILYESGAYKTSDAVLTVYAPKRLRLERVMNRDQADQTAILSRMNKQWPESRKLARADFVMINDGRHALAPQVAAAIRFFQRKFKENESLRNH
ncbi:MAG: dephospho-CoA kinase [Bacteroidota bacterium]